MNFSICERYIHTGVVTGADFSSLLPKGGNRVWQITHFEDPKPAAAYLSQLLQDPATGNLTVISTQCACSTCTL